MAGSLISEVFIMMVCVFCVSHVVLFYCSFYKVFSPPPAFQSQGCTVKGFTLPLGVLFWCTMLHIYNTYTNLKSSTFQMTAPYFYYTIAISVIHVKTGHISATLSVKVWFCAVDLILPVGSPLVPSGKMNTLLSLESKFVNPTLWPLSRRWPVSQVDTTLEY